MGRPRLHPDTKAANATRTRRKRALVQLLANGSIRLHTADAAADAAWILEQDEATGAEAWAVGETWNVVLKSKSATPSEMAD